MLVNGVHEEHPVHTTASKSILVLLYTSESVRFPHEQPFNRFVIFSCLQTRNDIEVTIANNSAG